MYLFLQDSKHKPSIGKNIPDEGRGENGPWLWANQWEHFTDRSVLHRTKLAEREKRISTGGREENGLNIN
jgi:hypothetical protein